MENKTLKQIKQQKRKEVKELLYNNNPVFKELNQTNNNKLKKFLHTTGFNTQEEIYIINADQTVTPSYIKKNIINYQDKKIIIVLKQYTRYYYLIFENESFYNWDLPYTETNINKIWRKSDIAKERNQAEKTIIFYQDKNKAPYKKAYPHNNYNDRYILDCGNYYYNTSTGQNVNLADNWYYNRDYKKPLIDKSGYKINYDKMQERLNKTKSIRKEKHKNMLIAKYDQEQNEIIKNINNKKIEILEKYKNYCLNVDSLNGLLNIEYINERLKSFLELYEKILYYKDEYHTIEDFMESYDKLLNFDLLLYYDVLKDNIKVDTYFCFTTNQYIARGKYLSNLLKCKSYQIPYETESRYKLIQTDHNTNTK